MKIGVFDSGLGGVSVLKELIKEINADFLYLSDSKNNPYGDKTKEEITNIVLKNIEYLINENCNPIVIACNTATAVTIDLLRSKYKNITFIGTEPAIKVVYDNHENGTTVLFATKLTLETERINNLIEKYKPDNLIIHACIGLADLIEKGHLDKIEEYFNKNLKKYKNANTIILGCTHYSLIKEDFKKYFTNAKIIDGNIGITKETKRHTINQKSQSITFIDTKNTVEKQRLFDYFLKK